MKTISGKSEFVFPGRNPKKPLSNMALLALLHRMGRSDITSHGFRSSFRDWVAEATNFDRDLAEMQLAHRVAVETEEAYWRSTMLEKRHPLVAAWADYCSGVSHVVSIARAVA